MGMPNPPDLVCLVAKGDSDHAVATIEQLLQDYAAWNEQLHPGGPGSEQQLESMDRGYTENKLEQRRKRERERHCVVQ